MEKKNVTIIISEISSCKLSDWQFDLGNMTYITGGWYIDDVYSLISANGVINNNYNNNKIF